MMGTDEKMAWREVDGLAARTRELITELEGRAHALQAELADLWTLVGMLRCAAGAYGLARCAGSEGKLGPGPTPIGKASHYRSIKADTAAIIAAMPGDVDVRDVVAALLAKDYRPMAVRYQAAWRVLRGEGYLRVAPGVWRKGAVAKASTGPPSARSAEARLPLRPVVEGIAAETQGPVSVNDLLDRLYASGRFRRSFPRRGAYAQVITALRKLGFKGDGAGTWTRADTKAEPAFPEIHGAAADEGTGENPVKNAETDAQPLATKKRAGSDRRPLSANLQREAIPVDAAVLVTGACEMTAGEAVAIVLSQPGRASSAKGVADRLNGMLEPALTLEGVAGLLYGMVEAGLAVQDGDYKGPPLYRLTVRGRRSCQLLQDGPLEDALAACAALWGGTLNVGMARDALLGAGRDLEGVELVDSMRASDRFVEVGTQRFRLTA